MVWQFKDLIYNYTLKASNGWMLHCRFHCDVLLSYAKIVALVLCYYPCSIGLTFYQKWMLQDFKFPLFMVLIHFTIKFFLAALLRHIYECTTGHKRVVLPWKDCLFRIAPTGAAASIDIGLSNWSLEFITVSLYTMAKSSSIAFVLIFAVIFSLEKLRCSTVAVCTLISIGLFLFTFQSTQFSLSGFLLVELAAACSGIRWTLSQVVTQRQEAGLHNPIDMIFHIQPWMLLAVVPIFFAFEGVTISLSASMFDSRDLWLTLSCIGLVAFGGMLAFLMEVSEYFVLTHTSSLTLNVLGIVKEIFTLLLAHYYHGDVQSYINMMGLFICLCGIMLYVAVKTRVDNTQFNKREQVEHSAEGYKKLSANESSDCEDDASLT